jgi:hypothetical protein
MIRFDEQNLRDAFAPARELTPTDAEIAAVMARVEQHAATVNRGDGAARAERRDPRPGRGRAVARRLAPIAAALVLLLAGGYAAAPPVRAAIDDIASSFSGWAGGFTGWVGGDDAQAPGRPLSDKDAVPDFFRDPSFSEDPRVIAEAGGYKLSVARTPDGALNFDLGNTGVGLGGTPDDMAQLAGDRPLLVLGPGALRHADRHGHVPLFGVTAEKVRSVELTYERGPSLRVDGVRSAFVLLAEPARWPTAVLARDAGGVELQRVPVSHAEHSCSNAHRRVCIDWSQYEP